MSAEYCRDYVAACMINEIVLEQQIENRYQQRIESLTGSVAMMESRIQIQDNMIRELKSTIKELTRRKGLRRII